MSFIAEMLANYGLHMLILIVLIIVCGLIINYRHNFKRVKYRPSYNCMTIRLKGRYFGDNSIE